MDNNIKQENENAQFEQLIQGLLTHQYGCSDNFVPKAAIAGLRNRLQALSDLDSLKAAGIGRQVQFQQNSQIRGDEIKWIEPTSQNAFELIFLKKMLNFVAYLNRTCFTSILQFESHYARYPQKHFYKKHFDQFTSNKGRKFSIILYLNEQWEAKDEGNLSLYPTGHAPIQIEPLGGRIVFFRSDEMEHEVHPSFTKERMSIAGWLKD